jgi:membrane protein YdbS with pleckstrin-like domain
LSPEAVPHVADGVERPLDPAWIDLQRVVGWIVWAVLSPLLLLALLVAAFTRALSVDVKVVLSIAWIAAVALLAWLAQKWPEIEYRYFRYRLDALGIDIRHGVVWRRVISVPRSRVQHIDVAQGPLERRYGLSSLSIYTAGTEYAMVPLRGITHESALWVRDRLLPKEAQDAV